MRIETAVPVLGFAAYSGAGKTTLLVGLIPLLRQRGKRIGVIKHAHHRFEIDRPGKDSYEIRKAGADQVLIGSRRRWALMVEEEAAAASDRLRAYLARLNQARLDLILVEGFKPEAIPKIELYRPSLKRPLICKQDDNVIAIATDGEIEEATDLPLLDLNDHAAIATYIIRHICRKPGLK